LIYVTLCFWNWIHDFWLKSNDLKVGLHEFVAIVTIDNLFQFFLDFIGNLLFAIKQLYYLKVDCPICWICLEISTEWRRGVAHPRRGAIVREVKFGNCLLAPGRRPAGRFILLCEDVVENLFQRISDLDSVLFLR
jgi:hypothetical protein